MLENEFSEIKDFLFHFKSPYLKKDIGDTYSQISSSFFSELESNVLTNKNIDFPNLPGWAFFKMFGGQRYERVAHELLFNFLQEQSLRTWNHDIVIELFNLVNNIELTNSDFSTMSEKVYVLESNSKLIIDIIMIASDMRLGIEIKTNVGTKFHKEQEDKYIEWMETSKNNNFVLICPSVREYEDRDIGDVLKAPVKTGMK